MNNTFASPPNFPRPSSTIHKARLKNRLQVKSTVSSNIKQLDTLSDPKTNPETVSMSGNSVEKVNVTTAKSFVQAPADSDVAGHANASPSVTGWEEIANSIVDGQSEFFYLRKRENEPYKFTLSSAPQNRDRDFSTVSQFGVLRCENGAHEHLEFDELIRVRNLFIELKKLPIFSHFREWKTFSLWRIEVSRRKFARRVRFTTTAMSSVQTLTGHFIYLNRQRGWRIRCNS